MRYRQQLLRTRLIAVGTATALCLGASLSAQSHTVSDSAISSAVQRQFAREAAVPRNQMDVLVKDGIVTLDGEVETLAAKQVAEDAAGMVRGVRSVINRLRLLPTTKTDDVIQRDVETALRVDPVAELYQIDIHTGPGGSVELTGEVESWAEREQVEKSIMTVPGVMRIDNELTVELSLIPRGAGELTEEIASRLRWDLRVDDSLINVLVLDGSRVVLSGTVGSLAEKRHAERLARVAGVAEVRSTQLTVEPWARNDELRRAALDPKPTDTEISSAIDAALLYDPRVAVENVAVTTRRGVVRLTGNVSNLMALRAAAEDARNTYGVHGVENELIVEQGARDDEEIRQVITGALRGYGLSENNEIKVQVVNGTVRLVGDVRNASAHWQAESVAAAVRGVINVHNEMTIEGKTPTLLDRLHAFDPQFDRFQVSTEQGLKTDREIHAEIESELFWSPFVDSDEIDVQVNDGVVTLTGEIDSARELAAAYENAYEGGALVVHNELRLQN